MSTITFKDPDGGEYRFTQNDDGQIRVRSVMLDGAEYSDFATPVETMLFHRLLELSWIPITERMPTPEDANECGDVDWSGGKGIWEAHYSEPREATHWRRIVLP